DTRGRTCVPHATAARGCGRRPRAPRASPASSPRPARATRCPACPGSPRPSASRSWPRSASGRRRRAGGSTRPSWRLGRGRRWRGAAAAGPAPRGWASAIRPRPGGRVKSASESIAFLRSAGVPAGRGFAKPDAPGGSRLSRVYRRPRPDLTPPAEKVVGPQRRSGLRQQPRDEPCRGDRGTGEARQPTQEGVALAGEASPRGRHLPEVVSLTAAHGHDFARLLLQETPPGKGGDEVAPYLTYTLSTLGRPAQGVRQRDLALGVQL